MRHVLIFCFAALVTITSFVVPAFSIEQGAAASFVMPTQSFGMLRDFLSGARQSIFLASYILTSEEVAALLLDARARGVNVSILLDGAPVGGLPRPELLCELAKNGIRVRLSTAKNFMHAKYVAVDNSSALVSTENFVVSAWPAYPEKIQGNRGWGATVTDKKIARRLAEVFVADSSAAEDFDCSGNRISKRANFAAFDGDTSLIFGPNAKEGILRLIGSANRTIYALQFDSPRLWNSGENGFLSAIIQAARRGVKVKILLDGSADGDSKERAADNSEAARFVNEVAARENLTLEARIADEIVLSRLGVSKIHAKGLVIDDKTALISSINWAPGSAVKNREVGLVVNGDAAANLGRAFLADWATMERAASPNRNFDKEVILIIILAAGVGLLYFSAKNKEHAKTQGAW